MNILMKKSPIERRGHYFRTDRQSRQYGAQNELLRMHKFEESNPRMEQNILLS